MKYYKWDGVRCLVLWRLALWLSWSPVFLVVIARCKSGSWRAAPGPYVIASTE